MQAAGDTPAGPVPKASVSVCQHLVTAPLAWGRRSFGKDPASWGFSSGSVPAEG